MYDPSTGLCSWAVNIVKFYRVFCDVEPKRKALAAANAELAAAQAKLSKIKAKIKVIASGIRGCYMYNMLISCYACTYMERKCALFIVISYA